MAQILRPEKRVRDCSRRARFDPGEECLKRSFFDPSRNPYGCIGARVPERVFATALSGRWAGVRGAALAGGGEIAVDARYVLLLVEMAGCHPAGQDRPWRALGRDTMSMSDRALN